MTQKERILNHLKHDSITSLEAIYKYGVTRLSAVVCELKKEGYPVKAESVIVKNKYGEKCIVARYSLEEK